MTAVTVTHNPHVALKHEPSSKQIAAACTEIQAGWDVNTRRARWLTARLLHGHDFMVQEAWDPPGIGSGLHQSGELVS